MAMLHIVRASAGSGKTFRLTLEYLSYLFDDTGNFRHILAVTFTNKATEEMKSRITAVLHELATGKPGSYLQPLIIKTGKTEKEIRLKSDIILRKILHNYSRFSVGTIDSFFQNIIRSFTREIGIQSNYNLELDDSLVLGKAVDEMFQRVDNDAGLRNWLIEFTESRIEDEKSWNLKKKIFELGKEIFKESYKLFADNIAEKLNNKEFLTAFRGQLHNITASFESALSVFGSKAMKEIEENNLSVDDFYQKSRGPAGFFQKLAAGNVPGINSYTAEVLQNPDKWFKPDNPKKIIIQNIVEGSLHPLLQQIADYYHDNGLNYNTAKILLRNFYTLGILADITNSVYRHTRNKNLFLISDSAQLINRIIDSNDAPFIYEKTGNYFHHFLMDEFQDTSGFQWQNFKPLISNSLSQNNNCLIVGDAKQSIYRWRNGNWEILSKNILNDFYKEALKTETLDVNWRSRKEIVEFNNRFFTHAPIIMQDQLNSEQDEKNTLPKDIISGLYADVVQQAPESTDKEGYVRFEFISSENDYSDDVLPKITRLIEELREKGYSPGDIAILTRNKSEGKEVADHLMAYRQIQQEGSRNRYDFISEESLFIGSSTAVRFIVSVFRYLADPEDRINNYYMLSVYLNEIKTPYNDSSDAVLPEFYAHNAKECTKAIMPEAFMKFSVADSGNSLYETLQQIIRIFNLSMLKGEQIFIQALKDMIIDFTERNSSGLNAFLDYWDETGSSKSISGAENLDAIRILTIHKSKGLEFKVVIMPYCNWKINPPPGNIIWCIPKTSPFNQIEILPVSFGSALENTHFADDFRDEKLKIYIDNLNLLYVAFTRAKNSLFCFLPDDERKTDTGITNISHLVGKTLKHLQGNDQVPLNNQPEDEKIIEFGRLQKPKPETRETISRLSTEGVSENDTLSRMRIARHGKEYLNIEEKVLSPLNYGKIMHELFAQIVTLNDINPALNYLYFQGKIGKPEMERIRDETAVMFSDLQVQSWFSGEWNILNERDILFKDHENKRPDRVLIKGKAAVVIDYKFGGRETREHREQVAGYGDLLKQMGYEQVETYLWYTAINKIIQVN